jgi:hypothetical protein
VPKKWRSLGEAKRATVTAKASARLVVVRGILRPWRGCSTGFPRPRNRTEVLGMKLTSWISVVFAGFAAGFWAWSGAMVV